MPMRSATNDSLTLRLHAITLWMAPLHVLVIDDNAILVETLALLLETIGHEVATAGSGQKGLEWLSHSSTDLVLLDMNLGGGSDGFEVARVIRAGTHGRQPYIVAISGNCSELYPDRARRAGCDEFVLKPMDGVALDAILKRVTVAVASRHSSFHQRSEQEARQDRDA